MRNILIIGGNRGIGGDLVEKLTSDGDNIFHYSRFSTQEAPAETENYHPKKFDVTTDDFDISGLPEEVHGYVFFPGTINLRPFERYKMDDFMHDLNVNHLSNVKILQKVMPILKKSPGASCVFFSTVAVGQGLPFHASIASAKGAVEGLMRSLAAEYAPKIRFNCIAPGLTETSLAEKMVSNPKVREASEQKHPLQRIGKPEDISEMTRFLLSEKSSWMTGQVISIDGGLSSIKK